MTYSLKTKLNYGVSVAALCILLNGAQMQNATAADMFDQAVRPTGVIWEGSYIGAQGGGGILDAPIESVDDELKGDLGTGFLYGVQAGYNWHLGDAVIGLEVDAAMLHAETGRYDSSNHLETDMLGTLRGRLGMLFGQANDTLLFASAGVGAVSGTFHDSSPTTFLDYLSVGLAGGAGIEHMFHENWSFKGESLFIGLNEDLDKVADSSTGGYFDGVYVFRAGLNYHF